MNVLECPFCASSCLEIDEAVVLNQGQLLDGRAGPDAEAAVRIRMNCRGCARRFTLGIRDIAARVESNWLQEDLEDIARGRVGRAQPMVPK